QMAGRLHAILLLALHLFVSVLVNSCYFTNLNLSVVGGILIIENKCDQTVWSVVFSWESQISNTGFTLRRGESRALQAPSSWYGIISGRTLCSNESRGNFSFATGDCESNKIECPGSYGWSTVTYIYFRIDYSGTNSYFISLEYGYNLPVMVVPSHSNPTCFSSGCMVGLNKTCPNKLMIYDGIIPIACSSACKESSTHENCCTNYFGSRQTCKATLYSQNFERACPLAYSYPYSDSNSTFTCPNTTNYVITFCPSSIPNTTSSVPVNTIFSFLLRKSQLTGRETVFDRVRPNTGRDTSGRTRVKDEIVRPHKDGASSYSHVHRSTHSSRSSRVTKPRDSRYNPYSYIDALNEHDIETEDEIADADMEDTIMGNELALIEDDDMLGEDLAIVESLEATDHDQNIQKSPIPMLEASDSDHCFRNHDGLPLESIPNKYNKSIISVLLAGGEGGERGLAALALISIIFAIAVILSAKRKSHSKDEDIEAAVMLKRYSYDTVTKMTKKETIRLIGGHIIEEEETIVKKMALVGLWCIQTNPADRPPMRKVVEMLEGSLEAPPVPPKPLFDSPPVMDWDIKDSQEISSFSILSLLEKNTVSTGQDTLIASKEAADIIVEKKQDTLKPLYIN
ncbi:LOW QUALITY PROTEIN: hypothetical protein HID58_080505, partial [Brassica napus]